MSDSAYLPPAAHGQKKLMPVTFSLEQEEMERTLNARTNHQGWMWIPLEGWAVSYQ